MKRFTFFWLSLVVMILLCPPAKAAEYKIAYVDLQRALNESIAGKEAKDKFSEEVKKVQDDILMEKQEIEKLGETLEKQGMMLTEEVRLEKEKDFLKMQRDYERKIKDSKQDLQIKDAELTKKILEELVKVVRKYGNENNYSFIYEKSSESNILNNPILYISKTFDITNKIIALYDAQFQAKKK